MLDHASCSFARMRYPWHPVGPRNSRHISPQARRSPVSLCPRLRDSVDHHCQMPPPRQNQLPVRSRKAGGSSAAAQHGGGKREEARAERQQLHGVPRAAAPAPGARATAVNVSCEVKR
eukprot:gene14411-biopygen6581